MEGKGSWRPIPVSAESKWTDSSCWKLAVPKMGFFSMIGNQW
jgi:hypothetical protein